MRNNPVNNVDPHGLFVIVDDVFYVYAVATLAVATYYAMRNAIEHPITWSPAPSIPKDTTKDKAEPKACPKENDPCIAKQAALNAERNMIIDALALEMLNKDRESLIAINNAIYLFNQQVKNHNRLCPRFPVLPLQPFGLGEF